MKSKLSSILYLYGYIVIINREYKYYTYLDERKKIIFFIFHTYYIFTFLQFKTTHIIWLLHDILPMQTAHRAQI